MGGFCRQCGSPLGGTEAFCVKCGAATNFAPSAAAAPPPVPQAPVAAPPVLAPASKGSPVIKIVLAVVGVMVLLAVMAVAGLWYVAHRVKQKVQALGLEVPAAAAAHRGATGSSANGCRLLSQDEVSQALGMSIARVENTPDSEGCAYYVNATVADLMAKKMSGEHQDQLDANSRKQVEALVGGLVKGFDTSGSEVNGQVPVLTFGFMDQGAKMEMSLVKGTLGRLGPETASGPVPGLGDDAFSVAGVMLYVLKGDRLLMMNYQYVPQGTEKAKPLAEKIVSRM
ncbi:MAG TPA: zinc ribbon domain-containing protein [Terriglobia bacterium]|nr:zinc ribbon domain-containing protein [Terriglobia bacterium]